MFCPISVDYVILSFHRAHSPAQGLGGAHSELWDANSPEDVARWEVNHAANEKAHTHTKREREITNLEHRSLGGKGAGAGHPLDLGSLVRGKRRGS
jgi:hypothetical protein